MRWVKIAESVAELRFPANRIVEWKAEEKTICLGMHQDQVFAFAQKCPHASGYFVEGFIDPLGHVVIQLNNQDGRSNATVDISSLASGTYFIKAGERKFVFVKINP